jgi:hypothetical protein
MSRPNGFTLAGHIGVDSGQVMLIDPCYIKADFESEYGDKPALNYAGACKVSLSSKGCGNFGGNAYSNTLAFCTGTTHGDGVYPVYVKKNRHGRVTAMMIDFDPPEEDEDDGDDE